MDFEWDEAKNRRNLARHSISFEEAARVFAGPMVREVDDRGTYGETGFGCSGWSRVVSSAWSTPCARTVCGSSRRGEPAVPKDGPIVRYDLDRLPEGPTDWKRVDQLTDEEIEAAIRDDPDAAPISDQQWFEQAQLIIPAHLKHLWVQIDEDLTAWFQQQGKDWPAKINSALREYVETRRSARKRAG
jgi:uncharacterized protein (DUF4415 family)